jgi:PleD family two-component response regulator
MAGDRSEGVMSMGAREADGDPLAALLRLDGAEEAAVLAQAAATVAALAGEREARAAIEEGVLKIVRSDGGDLRLERCPATARATIEAVARLALILVERARLRTPPPSRVIAPRRVLIVEDERHHAELVAMVLERRGYAVEVAGDGNEGLKLAAKAPPDLILLDVWMPSLDGFAAAAALRSDERTRGVPILFLSACDEVGTQLRGMALGPVDYLPKPFHGAELLARVETVLADEDLRTRARSRDGMGLGDRRYFSDRLALETARAERYRVPLSLTLLASDGEGDARFVELARVARDEARNTDLVARIAPNELAVILPHTALAESRSFGERVRRRLASEGARTTASVGIAAHDPGAVVRGDGAERLLEEARAALESARASGGDRVAAVHDPR